MLQWTALYIYLFSICMLEKKINVQGSNIKYILAEEPVLEKEYTL